MFARYRPSVWMTAVLVLATGPLAAIVEPDGDSTVAAKAYRHADLDVQDFYLTLAQVPAAAASEARRALGELGVATGGARLDARSGRFETLLPARPLLPGDGAGNTLAWDDLAIAAPADRDALEGAGRDAFRGFLEVHAQALGIDAGELGEVGVTAHEGGDLIQIHVLRRIDGLPVAGSYVSGVVNHGNLVLLGVHRWDAAPALGPDPTRLSSDQAGAALRRYLQPLRVSGDWGKPQLLFVPMSRGRKLLDFELGSGYDLRLVWAIRPRFEGDLGHWQALVDAVSGEVLSFEDTNHYAEIKGGVLPVTNDGIDPDGVEQAGWPMPFDNVSTTSGTQTSDTGGNLVAAGSMTSNLAGPFIRMNDNCGAISLTQSDGIDFGTSAGTDCTTPGFGGDGNTHASRTGFYELNKIKEMARGWLPANVWLQQQLTSNMNINQTCNAFWGGGTVNFYRSGGGCFNTGEIAGVFDHEWGHGLDDNDAFPTIASPSGEGIADIYTALRLNSSCIGRNFRSTVCSGFGDPCLSCTGVRDIDYLKRQSGQPHDYTWSNANCGGSVHCVGGVYSEAVWSLWKRGLQSAPYNYTNDTAHEIVNRLSFLGAGNVETWFSGGPPFGGCGCGGGYLNYLAVDDDDGDLNNGTPHMTAIYNAFNDQEIACSTPVVQDSGCAGTPSTAPVVTTNPGNQQIGLTWGSVSGASEYHVFRTEGVFACDLGKVKIGETAGTSWNDSGLQNGRDYSYVVIPMGAEDACFGPASACATEAPVGEPDFSVTCSPSSLSIAQGGDESTTCTVISSFGYTGSVGLSCSGNPPGIGCAFSPSPVSPPADGSADSTLTVTVDGAQATGTFAFDVVGDDGSATRTAGISVLVFPAGSNGPQDGIYDAGLGAPKCAASGSSCDSGDLLDSRGNLSPPETNQSNTLDDCDDGDLGSYHGDESIDRIVVSTLDNGNFTEGDTVQIDATVWAWSTGSSDTLDLYYAADAMSPSWVFITSLVPPGGGERILSAQYTLPAGGMQAVRANFRYLGAVSACSPGGYDDHDDLVFTVEVPCIGDGSLGDSDGDGVCDDLDLCPGFDDNVDTDGDNVPDGCDACVGVDDLVLSAEVVTSTVVYEGCSSIIAGDGFQILAPGDVTLRAGSVGLDNGLSVGPGATLSIELVP